MAKPKRVLKTKSSKPSMRDLANSKNKPKRSIKKRGSKVFGPLKKALPARKKKERKIFKLPDNRLGRFFDKLLFSIPRYLRGAWGEIRKTTWPGTKETIRLSFAVFVFSAVFALFVAVLDFVLDKIFKNLIIK